MDGHPTRTDPMPFEPTFQPSHDALTPRALRRRYLAAEFNLDDLRDRIEEGCPLPPEARLAAAKLLHTAAHLLAVVRTREPEYAATVADERTFNAIDRNGELSIDAIDRLFPE